MESKKRGLTVLFCLVCAACALIVLGGVVALVYGVVNPGSTPALCRECDGTGVVLRNNLVDVCPTCEGSGENASPEIEGGTLALLGAILLAAGVAGCVISFIKIKKIRHPEYVPQVSENTYIVVALAVVAILGLFLLLRSCDENGQTVAGTVSGQPGWSAWVDELPEGISEDSYDIEERTLYSSRIQETTQSTDANTMDGWELYDTFEAAGEPGEWSAWSDSEIEASATREVETQLRYRYRDKETTTDSVPEKDGWIRYDATSAWGDYGSWSNWSTAAVSNSDSRKVETKTQYRYRNISYSTEYTGWSSWSSWSFDRQSTSDLKKEESRYVYGYYYYTCPNCGAHMHGWDMYCPTWAGGCGKGWIAKYMWTEVYSTVSWDAAGLKDWHGTGKYYTYIDGQRVFQWTGGGTGTQYRYATRSTQQVTNYGSWSGWEDAVYTASSNRLVETRTVYRYCERSQNPTYYFYRWGEWSDWSDAQMSATDDRQVETVVYYRYRNYKQNKIYCFKRWTEWSDYSEEPITAAEMREIQTKTQYRYKMR